MSTTLTVDTEEFDRYRVSWAEYDGEPQPITFSLKEFKAIISLADGLGSPLEAFFSTGGECVFEDSVPLNLKR
jgi:hypothetical protein